MCTLCSCYAATVLVSKQKLRHPPQLVDCRKSSCYLLRSWWVWGGSKTSLLLDYVEQLPLYEPMGGKSGDRVGAGRRRPLVGQQKGKFVPGLKCCILTLLLDWSAVAYLCQRELSIIYGWVVVRYLTLHLTSFSVSYTSSILLLLYSSIFYIYVPFNTILVCLLLIPLTGYLLCREI